jgi:small subunit ribosomal protein S9
MRMFCTKDGGGDWWGDSSEPGTLFDEEAAEDENPTSKKKGVPDIVRREGVSSFNAAPVRRTPIVEGTPKLSMAQALYLAKEAGVFTTREIQTHLIKSPSFSTNDSPFLLENFFSSPGQDSGDPYSADLTASGVKRNDSEDSDRKNEDAKNNSESTNDLEAKDFVPEGIHKLLSSMGDNTPYFTARGREWKVHAEGKGTRKRATAHVIIQRGTGIVKVNGEEDFYKRFPILSNRLDVLFPMEACRASGLFDVYIGVKGGGISGQAGAARLALGRALVNACAFCEDDLKDTLVLYEDTRQRTSKFPGKKGAYARRNWTLR